MKLYGLVSDKKDCLMGFNAYPEDCSYSSNVVFGLSALSSENTLWVTHDESIANSACENRRFAGTHSYPVWNREEYGNLVVVCLNYFILKNVPSEEDKKTLCYIFKE